MWLILVFVEGGGRRGCSRIGGGLFVEVLVLLHGDGDDICVSVSLSVSEVLVVLERSSQSERKQRQYGNDGGLFQKHFLARFVLVRVSVDRWKRTRRRKAGEELKNKCRVLDCTTK